MRLFPFPPATTLHAIANRLGWTALPLDKIHERVIWDYRLSRALVASLCGAGLALCGAILQPLLRNPLAEPDVPDISAVASTGTVSVIVPGIGAGAVTLSGGAFADFLFVVILASGARGGADCTILAGVTVSRLFNRAGLSTRRGQFWQTLSGGRASACALCILPVVWAGADRDNPRRANQSP